MACTLIPPLLDNPDPNEIILRNFAYRMARFRRGATCAPLCEPIILLNFPSDNQLRLWRCFLLNSFCILDAPTPNEKRLAQFNPPDLPPPVPFPSPCDTDNFQRASGNNLGSSWNEDNETTAESFQIAGPSGDRNLAINTDAADLPANDRYGYVYWDKVFKQNQSCEAEFRGVSSDDIVMSGVGVRMSGTKNNFTGYVAVIERVVPADFPTPAGPLFLRLYKAINHDMRLGSGLTLLKSTSSPISVPSVGETLKISVTTGIIRVLVDDFEVFKVSDNTITSGRVGMVGLINTFEEDLVLNATTWDNWEGCGLA